LGDVFNYRLDILERELEYAAIRLDRDPPDVRFSPDNKGGILVRSTVTLTKMTGKEIAEIVRAYGMVNGTVTVREDIDHDALVDALAGNRVYIPSVVVINKFDLSYKGVEEKMAASIKRDYFKISVAKDEGIEELRELIFRRLGFIRVYLKPQHGKADLKEPLVLLNGSTVRSVCEHLHRDFVDLFRYAHVWGPSAKHPGQSVGLNHELLDEDILTVVLRK